MAEALMLSEQKRGVQRRWTKAEMAAKSRANLVKARRKRKENAKARRERKARLTAEVDSALGEGKTLRRGVINIKDMTCGAVVDLGGRKMVREWAEAQRLTEITRRKQLLLLQKYPIGKRKTLAYRKELLHVDEALSKEKDRREGIMIAGVMTRMLPSAQVIERHEVATADAKDVLAEIQRLGQMMAVKTVGEQETEDVG